MTETGAHPAPRWTAEKEARLIEMVRLQHTLTEIARELGIPPDMIEKRLASLALEGELPQGYA